MGVNGRTLDFAADHSFSVGAMTDSAYEYLPKQYMMLGGLQDQYRKMYEDAIEAIRDEILFRPLNEDNLDILVPGIVRVERGRPQLDPQGEHLACFAGGMVGIGAKIFLREDDLAIAQKLVDGCVWAYSSMPSGIMPEMFHAIPCGPDDLWNQKAWHKKIRSRQNDIEGDAAEYITSKRLQPGFTDYGEAKYSSGNPPYVSHLCLPFANTNNPTSPKTRSHRIRLHPLPHHQQPLPTRYRLSHVRVHQETHHDRTRQRGARRRHDGSAHEKV